MKDALTSLIRFVAELLGEPLRAAAMVVAHYVNQLDIPDGDGRWPEVMKLVEQTVDDIRAASERSEDPQAVRDAAEHRMHLELRRLGLIERG